MAWRWSKRLCGYLPKAENNFMNHTPPRLVVREVEGLFDHLGILDGVDNSHRTATDPAGSMSMP